MLCNGASRDIHGPLTDVFSASFDEISADGGKMAFFRRNSLKACAKLLGLKQRRMSGRCRRSCDNSATGTPAATFYCRTSGIGFFMPLSSSVLSALRQLRTILVDARARGNGMRDLEARIADVHVRTSASAALRFIPACFYLSRRPPLAASAG